MEDIEEGRIMAVKLFQFIIFSIYMPNADNRGQIDLMFDTIRYEIERINDENNIPILTGDMNAHVKGRLADVSDYAGKKLEDLLEDYGMYIPLEEQAITYISSAQIPSQIDMVIGPQHLEDMSFECKLSNFKPSDHFALSTSLV